VAGVLIYVTTYTVPSLSHDFRSVLTEQRLDFLKAVENTRQDFLSAIRDDRAWSTQQHAVLSEHQRALQDALHEITAQLAEIRKTLDELQLQKVREQLRQREEEGGKS
jgi:hypothetical protein